MLNEKRFENVDSLIGFNLSLIKEEVDEKPMIVHEERDIPEETSNEELIHNLQEVNISQGADYPASYNIISSAQIDLPTLGNVIEVTDALGTTESLECEAG